MRGTERRCRRPHRGFINADYTCLTRNQAMMGMAWCCPTPTAERVVATVRVLVVEDEPKMARLLRRGLIEEGYAVDVATDGASGYDAAVGRDYDAVVLDVILAGR